MATVIDVVNMREGYARILNWVRKQGRPVAPRGINTLEILNPTIVLEHPEDSLPIGTGRRLNLDIAAVEAVQLSGAFADDDLPLLASPAFARYREENGRFHGAYGRRIGTQAQEVAYKLSQDPDSRQAVVTLWDPKLDNLGGKRDYPCTVGFQFLIRDDKLQLVSNMRSNDAWLGLAYDVFQFSQLQWTVANMLGIEAGPLTHRPVSLHLYETNLADSETVTSDCTEVGGNFRGFGGIARAYAIGHGVEVPNASDTEKWFLDRVQPLIENKGSDD